MPAALPLKDPVKVGQLLRRRLRELKRTPRELAEAVQVTEDYMADLVSGRRRPPAPGRSDLYAPMTKFLRLHRNDLPTCARAERAAPEAAAHHHVGHRPGHARDADRAALAIGPVQKYKRRGPEGPRRSFCSSPYGLELHDVLRRRALLALHDVELDPLALSQ